MEEQKEFPEKKKSNIGKIILGVLVFLLIIILGSGFWAYSKITSAIGGEDLGVAYSYEDYEELVQNIGIDVNPERLCLDCEPLNFSNPHEVDLIITNEQASAAFDIANETLSAAGIRNSQIRFSDDKGELSTTLTYQGREYPVYISGNIQKISEQSISGEIFDLKVASFNIPSGVKNMVEEALVNLANERLDTMDDTFSIDDVRLTNEGLSFEGLVPTEAR